MSQEISSSHKAADINRSIDRRQHTQLQKLKPSSFSYFFICSASYNLSYFTFLVA
ncbi:hypothetical protein RchiOBHm_Chr2g0171961 [Rosa chinensis]|uniref:Uncharacterized protein n=1 Tax=Rosa chinensis TaxID=74649 RepID=A0A2P6S5J7_ROSCH|nr:hypothetical protein RchiOBHm_Chr2g0171961 [Rosa chinensis]